ncbi:hypothetical protein JYK14_28205 [Siccirubricoccus sp. KC 17139]|uniref:NTF2 fold domain-containing protein n=1 Tax=Siccirubricoccus soli TaxID=2899147 RepID=A0ABT1DFN6_9PROT|nr:hypothetical protein [Siccirubricoccus soli]MCO6420010.1 hypothetical protein [Siccirubricoccus soli]MCP2686147.1 hypothetical protein [Siccirubricoccus soli]
MTMKRLALLLPLLAACAQEPPLEARLAPLVGQSEAVLIASQGVPTRSYEAEGRKYLQYEWRRTQLWPSDPYPYWGRPYGRFGPLLPPPGPMLVTRGCDVIFTVKDGKVESFGVRGDDCR